MTTYATAKTEPATTGIADAKLYWKITAPVVGLVAVLGFLLNAIGLGGLLGGFLSFDFAHNAVHLLIAVVGASLGYTAASQATAKSVAKLFGIVYLGLAVVGFVSPTVFGIGSLLGLHLEIGENLIHLVLGSWAAYAGFAE